jgi:DNA-binding transcriptional LysR family regulator
MDRLETRELVYFVAVAENLHFGRAAEQLGIAQPPLSRAISKLERRIGVRLLERTSRRVALTAAGRVFLRECRKALSAMDGAVRRTQQAARPRRLVLAIRPGTGTGLLATVLDDYRRSEGAVPVDVVFTRDQAAALRDGTADLGLLCGSDDLDGLEHAELAEESPVVLLPATHPLAALPSVTTAKLVGESAFQDECPAIGLDEIIERVTLGRLVVVVGQSAAGLLGAQLAAVPVTDLPASQVVLGWPRNTPLAARDTFVQVAKRAAARYPTQEDGRRRLLQPVSSAG